MSITMGESSMANSFHTLPGIGSGPADLPEKKEKNSATNFFSFLYTYIVKKTKQKQNKPLTYLKIIVFKVCCSQTKTLDVVPAFLDHLLPNCCKLTSYILYLDIIYI